MSSYDSTLLPSSDAQWYRAVSRSRRYVFACQAARNDRQKRQFQTSVGPDDTSSRQVFMLHFSFSV